jgi:hypothetical protein
LRHSFAARPVRRSSMRYPRSSADAMSAESQSAPRRSTRRRNPGTRIDRRNDSPARQPHPSDRR